MAKKKQTALYFTTVCAFPKNAAVLGGHLVIQGEDPLGTRLMVVNNDAWTHLDDMMQVVYATVLRRSPGKPHSLAAVGRDGLYREFPFGGASRDIPIPKKEVGYLEDAWENAGKVYVCGAQGQVYRLRDSTWQAIDRGLRVEFNGQEVERMLLSISGFSDDDVYVCGFEGEVWHFDGKKWTELDSPTNLPLNAVLCAPDERVYVCGAAGTMFAIESDGSWVDLSDKAVSEETFYDMTVFKGKVYVAADEKLLYLDADKLKAVKSPSQGDWRFLAIDAADDRIWCVGSEEVFDYDGKKWTRHVCPENV
jgi:photosystem II stability/assembly factor-like uncharacterized protein